MRTQEDTRALAGDLRGAVVRLARRLRRELPEYGDLSISHLSALASLDKSGSLSPGELASIELVQPPSMTRTVTRLVELGLVQRTQHPSDGRQAVLALTGAGSALVKKNRRAREAWLAQRIAELTPAERATLRDAAALLDRMSAL
jgi:DNA-binding MarR family transcriptional regulator